jgi:restriction endonuclease Mrr
MKTVVKGGDAVKTFTRRDSCTAILKKLGVPASDYNQFIWRTTDGRFTVNTEKAELYLASRLQNVAKEVVQGRNKGATERQAESNQIKRPSSASFIRRLILDGKTNQEIFKILQDQFGCGEEKSNHAAWYRSQMRRQGLIDRPSKGKKKIKQANTKVTSKKIKPAKKDRPKPTKKAVKNVIKQPSLAQSNINSTMRASFKTGNKAERVAPLLQIQGG